MHEGHELDAYHARALLTGVVNRLGDARSKAIKCELPAWIRKAQEKVKVSKEEIALARHVFQAGINQKG